MSKQYRRRNNDYEPTKKINFTDSESEKAVSVNKEETIVNKVRVEISNLNIRKGPGKGFDRTGKFTGKGVFEINERKDGEGSAKGWGKLKTGEGWISLDFCEDVK